MRTPRPRVVRRSTPPEYPHVTPVPCCPRPCRRPDPWQRRPCRTHQLLWLVGTNSWFGRLGESVFGSTLAFTWIAAALAAAVVSLPLVVRSFTAALAGVDPRLEVAARGLSSGPFRTFFTITLPLAYRGVIAGALLGFVRALSEFGATIVVAGNIPGRTQTIPSAIFTRISAGDSDAAWRLAIVSILLGVMALAIHNWLLKRSSPGSRNSSEVGR